MASIRIDGEIYTYVDVQTGGYLPTIRDGRREWFVAEDFEQADDATLAYWKDLPAKEIIALVGEERIVDMWASGTTLEDFVSDIPACEQWGSYDGNESDIEPPTADERVRAAQGCRWVVAVTEPGGLSSTWDQTYESEDEAITAAEVWVAEMVEQEEDGVYTTDIVEGRTYEVFLHEDDEDLDDLREFVEGWDELVDELGFEPTVAYRHN